jgi:uncharacterized protein
MRKLILGLCLLAACPVVGQSLLWEVSGNGLKQPSYLFGTYHILKDSYLQQAPLVKKAYTGAEGVVVEMVMDSSKMMQVAMRGLMLDNSLDKLISPADYDLIGKQFKNQTGFDLMLFNRMKPVVTATMFGLAQAQKESDTLKTFTGQPIDLYFAANGKQTGKTILPLETMEEQITLLYDHDPVEKQAKDLVTMVRDLGKTKDQSRLLTQYYLKGDLDAMFTLMKTAETEAGSMAHLLDERNQNWMKRLPALLAARPTFVAVGAGHLPGPNGLIALLRKDGFTVKAVK